ncbi:MAG: translation initiation factor IF-2 [Pseudobacteriovorax sp.]|nr:translation initiation factor IF-2 [Pseudobacteriovorax sp.]
MSKVRVYELARELKVESKVLVSKVKEMGIDVSSHQSTLSADQVVQIKRQIQGGSEGTSKSPQVIRRRRPKKVESVAEEAKVSSDQKASDVSVEPKEERSDAQDRVVLKRESSSAQAPTEAPKEAVPAKKDVASEPVQEVVEQPAVEATSSTASEEKNTERKTANSESSETSMNVSPESTQDISPPEVEASKEEPLAVASKVEEKASRPSGGATIVRRATKEEVARVQRDREEKQERRVRGRDQRRTPPGNRAASERSSSDDRHSSGRSQDSRPPRPSSGGNDFSPTQASAGGFDPGLNIDKRGDGRGRDKKRGPTPETSEEAAAAKRAAVKQKRDQFSMRSILNQIDNPDELDVSATQSNRRKTVYTPQASSRKRDIKRRKDLKKTQITTPRASYRVVKMGQEITVSELAKQLSVKGTELIKKLMTQGMMVTINQQIDFDTASLLASDYNYEVKSNLVQLDDILSDKKKAYDSAEQVERPPIVTIMGHVDHGKTSILDAVRKAKVAAGEAGGITQHIGAYTVEKDGKKVAFLDTPGHEAFSSMRSRGAQVTDIVVLVVAADDGVMPQTVEAISHAKDAGVPIIVAINKMDKPNINLDRVYTELTEHGIQSEEWGGETQFVKVSALKGTGLDDLLDSILLQAEVLELQCAVTVPGTGVVVEAHLDKGRGPVATVIIRQGTLKTGDYLVAGTKVGRVRAMHDHLGKKLETAGPSTPVEIIGLSEVPMAGDSVDVVEEEKKARDVADWRKDNIARSASAKSSAASIDELLSRAQEGETWEVPIIIKGDTQGSVEAVAEAVLKLNTDRVKNRIVHKAVGGVNESDITLAETSGGVVLAFNVRAARGLDDMAEKKGVPIKFFSVIYDIVDVLKAIMAGKLPPVQKEVIIGHAEVRDTIKVPKIGMVAGTAVTDGKVTRNSSVRLIRDDVVIFSGRVGSLRRFKDDVKEVAQGYECGIGIDGYNDIRIGDVLETYVIEEEAPTL